MARPLTLDQSADHADNVCEIDNQLYPVDEFIQLDLFDLPQIVDNFQNI